MEAGLQGTEERDEAGGQTLRSRGALPATVVASSALLPSPHAEETWDTIELVR